MTWNYRVMEFTEKGETWLEIREVFYREDRTTPRSYSAVGATVVGEDTNGLGWVIERLQEALAKPTLTEKDFPDGTEETSHEGEQGRG